MFFRIQEVACYPSQPSMSGTHGFRSLEAAAQFIVTAAASRNDEERPWFHLVDNRVTPEEDYDDALAVVNYAAAAARYCPPGDWGAVVKQCVEFLDHEMD